VKALGEVVKLNDKKAKVRTLEARGRGRRPVERPPSLMVPVPAGDRGGLTMNVDGPISSN
jgi:hypothetical protein